MSLSSVSFLLVIIGCLIGVITARPHKNHLWFFGIDDDIVTESNLGSKCPNYPDTGVSVVDLKINQCTSLPCVLEKGKDSTFGVMYKAIEDFDELDVSLWGHVYGTWMQLPLPDPNVCDLGVSCPIKAGSTYKSFFKIHISWIYPSLTDITAQVRFKDEGGKVQGCVQTRISIKN